ncbi:hypothetical protein H8356DRAFT_1358299 [Neocallimastix lanati (nom. inval.)]|nr:hypothetical protein H8356DRAFT_1358299 [Neocallimastix sp. JGI-2020a]
MAQKMALSRSKLKGCHSMNPIDLYKMEPIKITCKCTNYGKCKDGTRIHQPDHPKNNPFGFCVKVFYISNTIRIPLRKPCLRGFTVTPPIVGSAFPRGSRRVLLYGRRPRTGMAVNHTPILLYGEDQKDINSIIKMMNS